MKTSEPARGKDEHEAARLAMIEHLGASRPEVDQVLQGLVDDVRETFETDLCMVNLILSDVQYFRAWSGELSENLAEARQDPASAACPVWTAYSWLGGSRPIPPSLRPGWCC